MPNFEMRVNKWKSILFSDIRIILVSFKRIDSSISKKNFLMRKKYSLDKCCLDMLGDCTNTNILYCLRSIFLELKKNYLGNELSTFEYNSTKEWRFQPNWISFWILRIGDILYMVFNNLYKIFIYIDTFVILIQKEKELSNQTHRIIVIAK